MYTQIIPVSLSWILPAFNGFPLHPVGQITDAASPHQLNSLIQVCSGLIQFSVKARLSSFAVLSLFNEGKTWLNNHKNANEDSLAFTEKLN